MHDMVATEENKAEPKAIVRKFSCQVNPTQAAPKISHPSGCLGSVVVAGNR